MNHTQKVEIVTPAQLRILEAFRKNPFSKLTFKELKTSANTHSHSKLQNALLKFQILNLIKKETLGDVSSYQLNLENNETLLYLALIDLEHIKKKKQVFTMLQETTEQLGKQTEFFVILLFGSYAQGKETNKSDTDIAIITEDEESKQIIRPETEILRRKSLFNPDFQIFTRKEFLEMLRSDEENVGKEIARNNFIYYGAEFYYRLIIKIHNETFIKTVFGTS